MDLSKEAREVFGQSVSGEKPPSDVHEWDDAHKNYNDRVKEKLKELAKDNKIKLEKMTKAQAETFVQEIRGSRDPVIKAIVGPVTRYTEKVSRIAGGPAAKALYRIFATVGIAQQAEQNFSTEQAACKMDEVCNNEARNDPND